MSRHAVFPYVLPLEKPSWGRRGCPGTPTSQSLSGNSHWDSESRHGNCRAFLPSPAISTETRPPAGLPGDVFPVMGGCVCVGGGSCPPPLLFPCPPRLHPQNGRVAWQDGMVFGRGERSPGLEAGTGVLVARPLAPHVALGRSFLSLTSTPSSVRCLPHRVALGLGQ